MTHVYAILFGVSLRHDGKTLTHLYKAILLRFTYNGR